MDQGRFGLEHQSHARAAGAAVTERLTALLTTVDALGGIDAFRAAYAQGRAPAVGNFAALMGALFRRLGL